MLAGAVDIAGKLGVSDSLIGLCLCAVTLFAGSVPFQVSQKIFELSRDIATDIPETAALLALSLVNTLDYYKSEERLEERDGLLQELRNLAVAHPDDINR